MKYIPFKGTIQCILTNAHSCDALFQSRERTLPSPPKFPCVPSSPSPHTLPQHRTTTNLISITVEQFSLS